ncbi:hypothetical protein F4679DRAFT_543535 [Xylaria curta]|nr:hypothetical protein F4679DRAFT_543535 [Xylaria curta]
MPLASPSLRHTPYIERWRSARDIFTQYDISRPSGWLSDHEGLSLSGDGNASPRRYCRYCHICSVPTLAPTHCSSCGHRLYERCKCECEVSSGTPRAHANFSHHPARDGSQYVFGSRVDPKLMQRLSQGKEVSRSISENLNHDSTDIQLHRPFNIRADTSWLKIDKCAKEATLSGILTPTSSDRRHSNEAQYEQNQDDASNLLSQIKKSNFDESPAREKSDIPHRHHSAGFHSFHHIAKHLSSAVGHNAYGLLNGRKVSSKAGVKQSPYLRLLTKPKPVTRIDSFQWTQDTVPPGHPDRPGGEMQRFPLTEALRGTIIPYRQKEMLNDLNLSQQNAQPHKLRLVSTPPWLTKPTKKAADATVPLHHVDMKRNETHCNEHAHVPSIALNDWRGHSAVRRINSIRKADTPEELRLLLMRTHSSPSIEAKVPGPSHVIPKIKIDPARSEHKRRYTPISVSKRRKIFEAVQDHADTASSVKKASHELETFAHQVQHQEAIHTTQSGLSRWLIES